MQTPLADLGLGDYVHDRFSPRFPVYTRGNAGEVYPEVVYPFPISLARSVAWDPFETTLESFGALLDGELDEGLDNPTAAAVFYGYAYLNVSISRVIAIRTPGVSVEQSDRAYLGSEIDAPPHRPHGQDRNLRISIRLIREGIRTLRTRSLPEVDADKLAVEKWREGLPVFAAASVEELLQVLHQATELTAHLFERHLQVSGRAGTAVILLSDFCEKQLGDASLALTMLGGIGDVESAEPARALWELAQIVDADPEAAAAFDAGPHRYLTQRSGSPFAAAFAAFIEAYGSRGPNEWDIASRTWGLAPELPLAMIDHLRAAGPDQAPDVRSSRISAERDRAIAEAQAQLRGPKARLFAAILRAATLFSQGRERQKTTVVKVIHEARLAGFELGRRLASTGRPDDLWYVYCWELDEYRARPSALAGRIASRRATRAAISALEPPFIVDGVMPPPSAWRRRDDAASPAAAAGTVLSGASGFSGITTGVARVVTDPLAQLTLGPGTILVAPHTDPSWTPLFMAVDAVVVAVGGQMSHAVIVARELGLPCVVNVTAATTKIPDGARITVDGSAGTVTLH